MVHQIAIVVHWPVPLDTFTRATGRDIAGHTTRGEGEEGVGLGQGFGEGKGGRFAMDERSPDQPIN